MGQASSGCGVWRVSVSYITSLFAPLPPLGQSQASVRPTGSGGLAVIESSPGAWQPPPSGQAGVGGAGGDLSQDAPPGPQAWHWAHPRR